MATKSGIEQLGVHTSPQVNTRSMKRRGVGSCKEHELDCEDLAPTELNALTPFWTLIH
jgi:hypothetical protein